MYHTAPYKSSRFRIFPPATPDLRIKRAQKLPVYAPAAGLSRRGRAAKRGGKRQKAKTARDTYAARVLFRILRNVTHFSEYVKTRTMTKPGGGKSNESKIPKKAMRGSLKYTIKTLRQQKRAGAECPANRNDERQKTPRGALLRISRNFTRFSE